MTQQQIDIHNIYPSIDELVPEALTHGLPHSLYVQIAERYAALGGKYMTDASHDDGRQINAIVDCDNLQSLKEEIIDAVFNLCGWAFVEFGKVDFQELADSDHRMSSVLGSLVAAYAVVALEQTDVSNR